jgi:hypothetical protein
MKQICKKKDVNSDLISQFSNSLKDLKKKNVKRIA